MTDLAESRRGILRFGLLAYLGAAVSLGVCFWKSVFGLVAPIVGLTFIQIDPHLQAVVMWLFAAVAVVALFFDRKEHGENAPFLIGLAALIIIIGTLYTFYDSSILASGYVLLLIAAFFNQNRMLSFLNHRVQLQATELAEMNNTLEGRVSHQVEEIERLARLKRFLPGEVADLITTEGKESLLESHRRYIACLFCDIRRFTSMTETMEPEDVMDVLRSFHEQVGLLVYTPIGHAVNLAARLSDRAQDGEILISRRTYVEVENLAVARSAGSVSLKGFCTTCGGLSVAGSEGRFGCPPSSYSKQS